MNDRLEAALGEMIRYRAVKPPPPESLLTPCRYYAEALENAVEVVELKDRNRVTYSWLFLPSRNTWPTKHLDRPAPTPGCECGPCHRPRCCNTWAEPVDLITGETVAWICAICLEPCADRLDHRPEWRP